MQATKCVWTTCWRSKPLYPSFSAFDRCFLRRDKVFCTSSPLRNQPLVTATDIAKTKEASADFKSLSSGGLDNIISRDESAKSMNSKSKSEKKILLGASPDEVTEWVSECETEKYRSSQIFKSVLNGAKTIDDLHYIPKVLKSQLKDLDIQTGRSRIHSTLKSSDGTVKFLLQLSDGFVVETVAIPADRSDRPRLTACVSSQVGCALKCTFCATGKGGFSRNLKAYEIIDQVLTIQEEMNERVTNIVFMGMGEPLLNMKAVLKAQDWIHHHLGISSRSITISTVGVPNGIRMLAEHKLQITLAVSLHAADQRLREQLVPSAKQLPLDRLFSDCRWYFNRTGRRISFEYTLLKGVNDSKTQARKLAKKLLKSNVQSHVNLMLWNPVDGIEYERPDWETAIDFQHVLQFHSIPTSIRKSRGLEKAAACGQLMNAFQKKPLKDFAALS